MNVHLQYLHVRHMLNLSNNHRSSRMFLISSLETHLYLCLSYCSLAEDFVALAVAAAIYLRSHHPRPLTTMREKVTTGNENISSTACNFTQALYTPEIYF